MTVRIIVGAKSIDVDVDDVDVVEVVVDVSLGVGGGDTAPGEDIVPANAETVSAMLRSVTAHIRRRLFTLGAS
jgi:hypothetical protein